MYLERDAGKVPLGRNEGNPNNVQTLINFNVLVLVHNLEQMCHSNTGC